MSEWYDKKLLGTLVIAIALVALIIYAPTIMQYFKPAAIVPTPTYKYTKDLSVGFKIMDDSISSLVTADVKPLFFAAGTNPFAINFVGQPVATAVYDSTAAKWVAVLDAGYYVLLITDEAATKTKYPVKQAVSVSGTNNSDLQVNLEPYMVHMVQRASPAITSTIYAYNSTSGAYDISVTNINVTKYNKWLVEYRISVSGPAKIIKAGRLYLNLYTGLAVSAASLDGVQAAVYTDTEAADDSITGWYVSFPDWTAGTHYLQVYINKVGTPAAGTLTLTLYEYYECHLAALRWWTDATRSISVVT